MDVSVIVPFRNERRYLAPCIEALLAQENAPPYEVLLVDNGSTDGSAGVAASFPVRVLSEPARGSYRARNAAVGAASGRILAFTDGDCVPEPDWLRRLVAPLGDASVELVLGGRVHGRETHGLRLLAAYENARMTRLFAGAPPELYYGWTNNLAVRRRTLEELGAFEEIPRGADAVLVRRLVGARGPGAARFVPEARVRHLEISSVRDLYRKRFLYGCNARRSGTHAPGRDVRWAERLELSRHAVRPFELPVLLALLAGTGVSWTLGRLVEQAFWFV